MVGLPVVHRELQELQVTPGERYKINLTLQPIMREMENTLWLYSVMEIIVNFTFIIKYLLFNYKTEQLSGGQVKQLVCKTGLTKVT